MFADSANLVMILHSILGPVAQKPGTLNPIKRKIQRKFSSRLFIG